jgi:hypothetical protein
LLPLRVIVNAGKADGGRIARMGGGTNFLDQVQALANVNDRTGGWEMKSRSLIRTHVYK